MYNQRYLLAMHDEPNFLLCSRIFIPFPRQRSRFTSEWVISAKTEIAHSRNDLPYPTCSVLVKSSFYILGICKFQVNIFTLYFIIQYYFILWSKLPLTWIRQSVSTTLFSFLLYRVGLWFIENKSRVLFYFTIITYD